MNGFEENEKHNIWRYGLVVFSVIGVMIFLQAILIGLAYLIEGNLDVFSYTPINLLWVSMLPFAGALVVLLLGIRFIHRIPIHRFFSGSIKFRWNLFTLSAVIWFLLGAVSDVILSVFQKGNYQWTFNASTFFPYMILAILLIAIQITAEEAFFRGYLQRGFSILFKNIWIAITAQAVLFGLLHGANTEVTTYGLLTTMPFYIGIGLLLGVITYKLNGLEASMGLHFANNIYATAFVTFSGSSITSPALFTIKNYHPIISLIVFLLSAVFYVLILQKMLNISSKKIKMIEE